MNYFKFFSFCFLIKSFFCLKNCIELINQSKTEGELVRQLKNNFDEILPEYGACIEQLLKTSHYKALERYIKELNKREIKFREILYHSIQNIQKNLENIQKEFAFINTEEKTISPAFQWAQSLNNVFIEVKFSSRFDSPGCVEIEKLQKKLDKNFELIATCKLDQDIIKFVLNLTLLYDIDTEHSFGQLETIGKYKITLKKKETKYWERLLLDPNTKIENMKIWFEMKDKYDYELKKYEKKQQKEEDENIDEFERALKEAKANKALKKKKKKNKNKKKDL